VFILERGADLHMAQLMPLPLTVSCFSKIQIGPGKRAVKRARARACVRACVCVYVCAVTAYQPYQQNLTPETKPHTVTVTYMTATKDESLP